MMVRSNYRSNSLMAGLLVTAATLGMGLHSNDVMAANFGYSYVEVGSLLMKPDSDINVGGTSHSELLGADLGVSYQPANGPLFFRLKGDYLLSEKSNTEVSYAATRVGAGFVEAVGDKVDLWVAADWVLDSYKECVGSNCMSASDRAIGVSLGARYWLFSHLELNGAVGYVTGQTGSSSLDVGAAIWLGKAASVRGNLAASHDDITARVGLRYTFGR